jgi:hypothetical protein
LDFGVERSGHATFQTWDGRMSLHLSPDEFVALFELFQSNSERLSQEIAELKEQRSE